MSGGKVARMDRVEWRIIPDQSVAMAALRAGEIDFLDAPPIDLVNTVVNNPDIVVGEVWPIENQGVFRMNQIHPPFNNLKARLAVAYAVNQVDYMTAGVGDKRYWRECYAYWLCSSYASSAQAANCPVSSSSPEYRRRARPLFDASMACNPDGSLTALLNDLRKSGAVSTAAQRADCFLDIPVVSSQPGAN